MTLTQALRQRAKEEAEAVWQKARADAASSRAERVRANKELREQLARELDAAMAEFARKANAEMERASRKIVAAAKAQLADRLYKLAVESLTRFRDSAYPQLAAALAEELPARPWQRATVNPADEHFAQTLFAQAHIVCDPAVTGGMEVDADEGRVRVCNTLESRLEAAWPEILPGLMSSVLEEISHARTGA